MTAAAVTDAGGVPEAIRRFCWRVWMVVRVPIFVAIGVPIGLFALAMLAMFGIMYGTIAYMGGALAGLAVALVAWVFGASPTDGYAEVGGAVGVGLLAVTYAGSGVIRVVEALRADSPIQRVRRVRNATAGEWRDAADRWPSRQRALRAAAAAAERLRNDAEDEQPIPAPPVLVTPAAPPSESLLEPAPPDLTPRSRAETITAWRAWQIGFEPLGPFTRQPVLGGIGVGGAWSSADIVAECMRPLGRGHTSDDRVPALDCSCGIYAVKSPGQVPSYGGDLTAFGGVELSGRVIEHEHGYRAERGRIVGPLTMMLHCSELDCGRVPGFLLIAADGETPVCDQHRDTADAAHVSDIDDFATQLRARLELRYGVDVQITKGAHTWT